MRSFRHSIVSFLVFTAAGSCLAGVGIGLWTLLEDQTGAGTLLLRGAVALVAVAVVSLVAGLLLSRVFVRSTREITAAVKQMRQGKLQCDPQATGSTELTSLAEQLRELGLALESRERQGSQKNLAEARALRQEALMRFGQGIAREVQKSLAGVLGFVEIALRQPGAEGQLKNYLTLIEQEARSGREALERVLRYVREEPYPTEPLEMNSLVEETSRGFLDAMELEKSSLQINLAKDNPRIMGDATQLKYVLTALINNAREAVLPAGGSVEISTSLDQEGRVVVMVKDSGGGIETKDQPGLFTPFFTSKGNRKGAGLSLAIAERIVSRHGGKLDFWSEPGKGSVFFVNLPPVQPSGTEKSPEQATQASQKP